MYSDNYRGDRMKYDRIKTGNMISELRRAAGMKQYEVGRLLGMSQTAYSKIEVGTNTFSIETLFKLSEIFNVRPETIICIDYEELTAAEQLELNKFKDYIIYSRNRSD